MSGPEPLRLVGRTGVLYQNKKFTCFAGCDYFRLSTHPKIVRAVASGLKKYGLTVAASRVTTGNHALYAELETALAEFFSAPAAVLVSNGYAANSVAAQALRGEFSHAIIDSNAHVSLRDAARFLECPILEFKNCDPGDLRRVLKTIGQRPNPILLTDGVFTHDVKVAPVAEYLKILGPRGTILLDDAHGAGIIGRTGRGTLEFAGVPRERIIQTVTLSKAFGVFGGALLCSGPLRERIITESPMYAGSTPLPLPLAHAALAAVWLLRNDQSFLRRLKSNSEYVKTALRKAGFSIPMTPVPVIAIIPKNPGETRALKEQLVAHCVFPTFVKYPGGPAGGYFRFVISSEHSRKQLDDLLAGLKGLR